MITWHTWRRHRSFRTCNRSVRALAAISFAPLYETIEELQTDLDEWINYYNNERTHQGKVCEGRTPLQTLEDGKRIWKEKFIS